MNTRHLIISAAFAGVLSALLSSIPIISFVNCLLCGWLWLGGIFAVWLYRRNTGASLVSLGQGAVIGLLAGLVAAVIVGLVNAFISAGGSPIPPETAALLEEQLGEAAEILANPQTMATFGIIINLVLYPLFGALGGLIGAALFKPKPVV